VAAFAPQLAQIELAAQILLAAQAADWAPIRHGDTLHDRASFRYYWSVLRRAHAAAQPIPGAAAGFFPPDDTPALRPMASPSRRSVS
jgi:citrate lyase subunit beta/citryl-CoA lyase